MTTFLPDKERGNGCCEILSNIRESAQGVSCSRSASRQNEMLTDKNVRRPCERLPMHTYMYTYIHIYIYSKPRSLSSIHSFLPKRDLCGKVLQDIPELPSFLSNRCFKNRAKQECLFPHRERYR